MEVSSQPIKAFPAHLLGTQRAAEDNVDALSRAPPKNATALARTRSQIIRDTAFGTDQDDLSDISDYDSPAPRSKVVRRSTSASTITVVRGRLSFEPTSVRSTARITRGRVGEVVLDSDDDAPPVAPPQQVRPRKKTLVREPTVDDDATSYPPSLPFVPLVSAASAVILVLCVSRYRRMGSTVESGMRISYIVRRQVSYWMHVIVFMLAKMLVLPQGKVKVNLRCRSSYLE